MHNKVLVIDDSVITGSYNFSRSAQFNAENYITAGRVLRERILA